MGKLATWTLQLKQGNLVWASEDREQVMDGVCHDNNVLHSIESQDAVSF